MVPCGHCTEFLDYSGQRLEKCPYGEKKPTCAKCPIHCYNQAQREQAREIMRYAGPRMTYRHPWLALLHLLDRLRRVRAPDGGAAAPAVLSDPGDHAARDSIVAAGESLSTTC